MCFFVVHLQFLIFRSSSSEESPDGIQSSIFCWRCRSCRSRRECKCRINVSQMTSWPPVVRPVLRYGFVRFLVAASSMCLRGFLIFPCVLSASSCGRVSRGFIWMYSCLARQMGMSGSLTSVSQINVLDSGLLVAWGICCLMVCSKELADTLELVWLGFCKTTFWLIRRYLEKCLLYVTAIFACITLCLACIIVPRPVNVKPRRLPCDGLMSLWLIITGVGLSFAEDILFGIWMRLSGFSIETQICWLVRSLFCVCTAMKFFDLLGWVKDLGDVVCITYVVWI